jgi:DNA (cytosine-5)-methyltransferase 1
MTDPRSPTAGILPGVMHIKLEDDEDDYEALEIDLTGIDDEDEGPEAIRDVTPEETHNAGEIPFGHILLNSVKLHGEDILPGDSIQLQHGTFLHNVRIFEDLITGLIVLGGNLLWRMRRMEGMLARNKVNELCLVLCAPIAGVDPRLVDCRVTRPLSDAVRKRKIILTNQKYPAHSVYENLDPEIDIMSEIRERAQLVCRWRFTEETTNSGKKITAGSIMPVSEADCDEFARASEMCLLKKFLSDKEEAGQTSDTQEAAVEEDEHEFVDLVDEQELSPNKRSYDTMNATSSTSPIVLTGDHEGDVQVVRRETTETVEHISSTGVNGSRVKARATIEQWTRTISSMHTTSNDPRGRRSDGESSSAPQKQKQRKRKRLDAHTSSGRTRTFADICTGAGGMASGARQMGWQTNFVLDECLHACRTLRLNYRDVNTEVLQQQIYDFCTNERRPSYEQVDVLHISYPCQPHSPVYNVEGKNHDKNVGALYSIGPILERCKPRSFTLEQTSGIVTHRGGDHFRALLCQITDAAYSVRWKICNLAHYGNVHARKRLIIIAACPGEILPSFPEPTHSDPELGIGPGMLPFVTIHDVLQKIRNVEVPKNLRYYLKKDEKPYNSHQPLKACITCDGGTANLHPSGKRTFTLFELAALAGFLPTHRFSGKSSTQIKKQIGNAVPSMFAKKLFEHIELSLQKSDRRSAAWKLETELKTVDLSDD